MFGAITHCAQREKCVTGIIAAPGLDLEPCYPALPRGHPDRGPLPRPRAPPRPGQKVSFLRPAAPGRITGTGRVVHRGGSIASLAGELRDETGDMLATATAPVRIIRPHRHSHRARQPD